MNMQFCKCEMESVTLVRFRLWPSSPEVPRVAFDFKLMELAVVLQLEGCLSLKSFCDAIIQSQNGFPVMVRPDEVIIFFSVYLLIFFSLCFIDDLSRQDQHRNAL